MDLEFLTALECKLAGDSGLIEGYGSTFGPPADSFGDIVAPGAFASTIAEHKAAGTMPAMLWGHDPQEPTGVWIDAIEDAKGLKLTGKLTLDSRRGAEARALAKDGALALSIGFETRDAAYENGRRILKDIKLWETSLVSMPANPMAKITAIKSAIQAGQRIGPRELEKALHDVLGLPKAFARRLIAGGYAAASADRCDAEGEVHRLCAAVQANTAMLNSFLRTSQHGSHRTQSRD